MKKGLISSCLVIMALLMIMVSGCYPSISDSIKLKGDFTYLYIYKMDGYEVEDGGCIAILELSLQGEQKETLTIPEEIDGKKVVQIGYTQSVFMGSQDYYLDLFNCKKIFFPKTIRKIKGIGVNVAYPSPKFIFFDSEDLKVIVRLLFDDDVYLSRQLYDRFSSEYCNYESVKLANVEYVVDGEICFVDDYDEGEIIEAPP